MCCIRVNFELLNYGRIVGYIYIHCYEYWFMSPSGRFNHRPLYWTVWDRFMQMLYLGRAPHTKEILLDFREKCRVTRHSRIFHELTGSQQTPGFWGVTHTHTHTYIYSYYSVFSRHPIVVGKLERSLRYNIIQEEIKNPQCFRIYCNIIILYVLT